MNTTSLKNNDVHHWSACIKEVIQRDYPTLPMKTQMIGPVEYTQLAAELLMENKFTEPVKRALQKMNQRVACIDNDIGGVKVIGLFVIVYKLCKETNSIPELLETLDEVDMHCIQGDTHRLFYLYDAIIKSSIKS